MKHVWIIAAILVAIAGTAWSLVPDRGSAHVSAGTSNFMRNWTNTNGAENLIVYAHSADIELIIYPNRAVAETSVVRAGRPLPRLNLSPSITGFKVIRTGSTIVDCYWW